MAAQEAKDHLDTFWLVGVIEQYKGFLAVLQAMMDPLESEPSLWESYAVGRYNKSPQGAGKVLAAIDPRLVQDFNNTLRQQWDVYGHAINLYKHRCRQMLRTGNLLDLCEVPEAPSEYTLTDLERESLYQELHPDTASLNVSEIVRAQQLWGDRGLANKDLGVDEAFEFFEEQGFDLTDQHKVENLWLRLGIGESPFAEDAAVGDGVSDDGGDGGVGEDVDGGAGRADVGEEADGEAGGPISEEILGRPEWPNR